MNQYLLLLHETPTDYSSMSPADLQAVIAAYSGWAQEMTERERLVEGHKLTDEGGRLLKLEDGALDVVDGPYLEAREIIGGLFVLRAESYDEAVELAGSCPHLRYGGRIELRQIDSMGADG